MSVSVRITSSYVSDVIFERPRLVLVEGADDQAVVAAMVRYEELEDFQVHNMSGNASWGERLGLIVRQPDFQTNVKALGLVRDADTNPDAAWDSCVGTLRRCSLPIPTGVVTIATGSVSVAVMIVPSRSGQGAIEDLCVGSFDEARLECVQGYFKCLSDKGFNSAQAKGHVQAYLAGLESAPRDLKVASDRGKLDISCSAFDELRAFVRVLAAAANS